jgi:hypothetical protein
MGQPGEGLPLQNLKKWPLISETAPGQRNVAHPALGDKSTIYLLSLHIKPGLIKIFVKAVDKESEEFVSLRENSPRISGAKKKEGIFVGPQIKQIFEDQTFSTKLNFTERRAWKALENIRRNILGKERPENYSETLQELISSHSAVGCNVPLKLHFLHSLSEFFLKTWKPSPMDMAIGSIRVFPKLKRSRWKMESKYAGSLQLKSYKGDTNLQI